MSATGGVLAVAGEALVDLVPGPGGVLVPHPGGGPFNTARAAARLGQATTFVGSVSRDALGHRLADALASDGVRLDERLRTDRPTSLALAELDPAGRASYRFYFEGTSAEGLDPAVARAALPAVVSALHVGGLGLVLEPLAQAVESLVEATAGQGLVMVDANVRPALIGDLDAYAERLRRIFARSDVVKVSDDDLRVLAPGQAPEAAARALLERGPRLVLLTLGPKGAVAFGAFGARSAPAPRVAVVDTIGAGDVFSGAWLARWLELGRPLADADAVEDALRFACRAAALSCASPGASPPTRLQLAEFR